MPVLFGGVFKLTNDQAPMVFKDIRNKLEYQRLETQRFVNKHGLKRFKKMDDPEMIRAAVDALGLDGTRTLPRIQDKTVKVRLHSNTESSVARDTFGSAPSFVGDEMFFGKGWFSDVEEEIEAAKAAGR